MRGSSCAIFRADLSNGAARIHIQGIRNRNELDDVDAPFAAFVFGNEALGFTEAIRQLLLSKTGLLSRGDQQLEQANMSRCAQ